VFQYYRFDTIIYFYFKIKTYFYNITLYDLLYLCKENYVLPYLLGYNLKGLFSTASSDSDSMREVILWLKVILFNFLE